MTRSEPNGVDHVLDVPSLHALLRLALGLEPSDLASWPRVHALAERERMLGVAWRVSAETIRRQAPAAVSSRWQRQAVQLGLHAERQLALLADSTRSLQDAGIDVIVLKGAPLAKRVYGDYTVRPSIDLDLHVAPTQRVAASRVLSASGWHSTTGAAPEEETFERLEERVVYRLEVHSSALDDPLLHHVEMPLESQLVQVGKHRIPAHSGRFVPAYLAAHLAKHNEKPLLWVVDFFLLWSKLSASEREDAIAAAAEAGVTRHLHWALALTGRIAACNDDASESNAALRRLAHELAPQRNIQRLLRLIALSPSPRAALRVLGGRIWPAPSRTSWRRAPAYFGRRAISWIYRHLVFERPSRMTRGETGTSVIALSSVGSERRLVDALRSGAAWIIPADGNMEPAIPAFGAVRVVPLGRRRLRVGDVVVSPDGGRGVLRRVASLGDGFVRLRGDARPFVEETISPSAIVGLCDLVDLGNVRVPIESRPYGMAGVLRAILRARLATLLPTRSG